VNQVTTLEARAILALNQVSYAPGIPAKAFVKQVKSANTLTDEQRTMIWTLAHRYRAQVRDVAVKAEAQQRHNEALSRVLGNRMELAGETLFTVSGAPKGRQGIGGKA
jgi:hypothetical protein